MKDAILRHFGRDYKPFFAHYLKDPKPLAGGKEWMATCPFHEDRTPSFNFNAETGRFICHGCGESGDAFKFFGKLRGLNGDFPGVLAGIAADFGIENGHRGKATRGRIVATYDYTDDAGKRLFQVVRFDPKDFRQRQPDGKGGWVWSLKGIEPVLYRLPEVRKADRVLLVEGEKDADRLAGLGFTATTAPMGAGKWRASYNETLRGKAVVVIPDNDQPGLDHAAGIAKALSGVARSVCVLELPNLLPKGDVSGFLDTFSDRDDAIERLALLIDGAKTIVPKETGSPYRPISAAILAKTEFPEPKWAVPGILTEGVSILAGKPKHGKSLIVLNLGLAIASGGKAFGGIDVEKGSVLYLALEDVGRRIKSRISTMLQGRPAPESLFVTTRWPKMDDGGLDLLESEIKHYSDLRLIAIDTLKMFRPGKTDKNKGLYDIDYEPIAAIKAIADKYSLPILLVTHLRKSDADDIMDTVSGSLGLTGAADSLLILERKTGQADACLHVTGRDIESREYAMSFDPQILCWKILGDADDVKATGQQQAVFDAIKNYGHPISPKEIEELTGLRGEYVRKILPRLVMEGGIKKVGRGSYLYIN